MGGGGGGCWRKEEKRGAQRFDGKLGDSEDQSRENG